MPICAKDIQAKIDKVKSKLEALEAEYNTLSSPSVTETVEEDPFDAEAEYNRVMGSMDMHPSIDMPDGDIEFQEPDEEVPAPPPTRPATSTADFMDDLVASRPETEDYETEEQKKARALMLEMKERKAEQKRKADDDQDGKREAKRQHVNSLLVTK